MINHHFSPIPILQKACPIFFGLVLSLNSSIVSAQSNWPEESWPQWGGPNRDHKSLATGLLSSWPADGPEVVWKFKDAGIGYSSPAVLEGKLYTLGQLDGANFAICLDVGTGDQLWKTEMAPAVAEDRYRQQWSGGPRSTPTIHGDSIFAVDDGGILCRIRRSDGELLWKVDFADFGGTLPKWGYSASPLIDGDRVVVCPGNDTFLVALDIETGKKVLESSGFSAEPHYVSVMKQTVGDIETYVTATSTGLVGFSAKTGETLWTNGSSGNSVATIPTPIIKDNLVYHTSDYGTGCVLVQLTANAQGGIEAKEIYKSTNMQNHHGGVLLLDENIFGFKRNGGWVCHDLMTGEVKWSKRLSGDGSAAVAYADNRIYVYGEDSGTCYLVEPSGKEWIEHGKVSLPQQTNLDRGRGKIWTHPVVAEGKLFLRDMDLIFAFDIAQ